MDIIHITFDVTNLATETLIGTCPESTTGDLNHAIHAASNAFPTWRALSDRQRGHILRKLFDLIVKRKVDLGRINTAENGKAKEMQRGRSFFSQLF